MFSITTSPYISSFTLNYGDTCIVGFEISENPYCCGIELCGNICIERVSRNPLSIDDLRKKFKEWLKERYDGSILQIETRLSSRGNPVGDAGNFVKLLGIDKQPIAKFYNRNSGNYVGVFHFNFSSKA